MRLVECRGIDPADGAPLTEHDRAFSVEVVVIRGKTGVNQRELVCLRIIDLNLPRAWPRNREILGEFIDRSILAERGLLLRGANPSRHPHTPTAIHGDAAWVSRPLPDFFGSPIRRRRGVVIDQGRARRYFDYTRRIFAWI